MCPQTEVSRTALIELKMSNSVNFTTVNFTENLLLFMQYTYKNMYFKSGSANLHTSALLSATFSVNSSVYNFNNFCIYT